MSYSLCYNRIMYAVDYCIAFWNSVVFIKCHCFNYKWITLANTFLRCVWFSPMSIPNRVCGRNNAMWRLCTLCLLWLTACLLIPPSHQTSSHYFCPNRLKLYANFLNVVQTSWTGYDVQNFEPAQNLLAAIPFWTRSNDRNEN